MRKPFAILILVCLLFLSGGYYFLYTYRLAEVKATAKKEMLRSRRHELTRFAFTPAEVSSLVWEDGHEFRYRGTMYDVVETETQAGQTVYWCLPDKAETALIDGYLKTQGRSSQKESLQSLIKLFQTAFVPGSQPPITAWPAERNGCASFFLLRLTCLAANVPSPPPRGR